MINWYQNSNEQLSFSGRSTTIEVLVSGPCRTETDITIRNQYDLNEPPRTSICMVRGKRNFDWWNVDVYPLHIFEKATILIMFTIVITFIITVIPSKSYPTTRFPIILWGSSWADLNDEKDTMVVYPVLCISNQVYRCTVTNSPISIGSVIPAKTLGFIHQL